MTTTQLPDPGSPLSGRQSESEVQANITEAARLYQRGVAAARGGQRRIAAGLLTRSVKLDPHSEQAWLWLSGVLDDPHQIAFCLQSVLKLNPNNERAQRGLRWIEERKLLAQAPARPNPLETSATEAADERDKRAHSEAWWVSWRQVLTDTRRVTLMWWGVPLLILALALLINQTFAMAIEQSNQQPVLPATTVAEPNVPAPNDLAPSAVAAPSAPVLETQPGSLRESQLIMYMGQLEPIRQDLRDSVDAFRDISGRPGSSLTHVSAVQDLRTSVQDAYETMQTMTPPPELQEAHEEYLKGLEIEIVATEALLEFYGTYDVELVNRAAMRFQEANTHFNNARSVFDANLQQVQTISTVSSHTIR